MPTTMTAEEFKQAASIALVVCSGPDMHARILEALSQREALLAAAKEALDLSRSEQYDEWYEAWDDLRKLIAWCERVTLGASGDSRRLPNGQRG